MSNKICRLCDPSFPVREEYWQNRAQELLTIFDGVEANQLPTKKRKPKTKPSGLQTPKSVLK